ncbi:MAG: GNAT family N-acetyltransferase [Bacteroidota bacterium]
MIKKRHWDSEFFDLCIGELYTTNKTVFEELLTIGDAYDLVYIHSQEELAFNTNSFPAYVKLLFEKELIESDYSINKIISLDHSVHSSQYEALLALAFSSGQHSRFKVDDRFGGPRFKLLYKLWLDNSLSRSFALDLLAHSDDNLIDGFVTLAHVDLNTAAIGLIAVHENARGKGIGGALLKAASNLAITKGYKYLQVATQEDNLAAVVFYEHNGFNAKSKTYTYHYWR